MVEVNGAIIRRNREALKLKKDIGPRNQGETKPSPGTDAAKQKEPVSELNVQNSNNLRQQHRC